MKIIDLRDFGLLEGPQSREERLYVSYGCEKR